MINRATPYRKIKNLCTCLALLISIGLPSMVQGGNLTSIAQLLGSPGDLGVDVTVTDKLTEICVDLEVLGTTTSVALTTDFVDTHTDINALNETICTLLKTILLQQVEIKSLIESLSP